MYIWGLKKGETQFQESLGFPSFGETLLFLKGKTIQKRMLSKLQHTEKAVNKIGLPLYSCQTYKLQDSNKPKWNFQDFHIHII